MKYINKLKKMINKNVIVFTIIILIITYIFIIISIKLIRYYNLASWDAISALGEWAGILIAILIPIAAVYLEKQLEKNKTEIKYSNVSLYDEITSLRKQLNEIKNNNKQENYQVNLKQEIYKFICISMVTTTEEIMNKFNIEFNVAKDILLELSRVDGVIRPAYIGDNPEDINCNWSKKR